MSFTPSLDQLGLPKELLDAANRANLTPALILLTPIPRLAELLRSKVPFARALVDRVARGVASPTRRLDEVYDAERHAITAGLGSGSVEGLGTDAVEPRSDKGKGKSTDRGRWISTGDQGMDQALGGGLRRGCLYEITGESAAGKSHLALTLALSTQLPSLTSSPGGSLILTSERELSTDRLVQLGKSLLATHEPESLQRGQGRVRALLDNVLTNRVGDVDALEHALNYAVPAILQARLRGTDGRARSTSSFTLSASGSNPTNLATKADSTSTRSISNDTTTTSTSASTSHASTSAASSSSSNRRQVRNANVNANALPIRLIVLDSITALFRGGTSSNDEKPAALTSLSLTERSKRLCIVADALKSLAVTYDLAVVVINQVSDVFTRIPSPAQASQPTSSFTQTQAFVGAGSSSYHSGEEQPPMLYASQARWFSGQSNTLNKEASLGIVWANAVNVRIMLSRTGRRRLLHQSDLRPSSSKRRKRENPQSPERERNRDCAKEYTPHDQPYPSTAPATTPTLLEADAEPASDSGLGVGVGVEVDDAKPTLIRRMHVVFCPFAPASTVDYAITPSGVHSLPGSYRVIDVTEVARKRRLEAVDMDMEDGTNDNGNGNGNGNENENEFDVFDDYGELPEEFWKGEYDYALDQEGRVVFPPVDVGRDSGAGAGAGMGTGTDPEDEYESGNRTATAGQDGDGDEVAQVPPRKSGSVGGLAQ